LVVEERRLAAIMFTDIVGYTALSQADEEATMKLLDEYRSMLRPAFSGHGGREVKTIGDGFLVEFSSSLEAVRSALEIQGKIAERNAQRTVGAFLVRIGIHVGEVIHRGDDVYGDAVNIASRIEPLAEPGGICVSRQVFELVQGKVEASLAKKGLIELKNVKAPMEIYKVAPLKGERLAENIERRVAVLPFANFSPESGDEYFADGLTEEMIGTLSKIRELNVISRTSVMQYKGRPKPIPEISRELNAGTILEGSVRKSGNRARVSIQMIDATEDRHVWAENYDRDLQDIFAVQSDIAGKVAEALKLQLLSEEKVEISQAPTGSVQANLHFLKGIYEVDKGSPSSMMKSMEHFEKAIKEDPHFAPPYAAIAGNYVALSGETMPGEEGYPKAKDYVERALALDPKLSHAQSVKGWVAFQYDWDWTESERHLRKSIELGPSNSNAYAWYGRVLASLGRFDEAIAIVKKALELDPAAPWSSEMSGVVYYMAGMNKEAREMFLKVLDMNPNFVKARMGLAFVDAAERRIDDAKVEADAAAEIDGEPFFQAHRAMIHANVGDPWRAREILDKILGAKEGYVAPGLIGGIYYNLGDLDSGYEWVKKSREQHDPTIPWEALWPIFAPARKDPRFVAMLKELGLP